MKPKLILAAIFISLAAFSQTEPIYKQFGNQVVDVSNPKILQYERGKIAWVQDGLVGVDAEKPTSQTVIASQIVNEDWVFDRLIVVTNFPDISRATVSQSFSMRMLKIGVFNGYEGQPRELYDCGKPYTPPPLTPEQIKSAQEAAQAHAIADKKRAELNEINAVRWLQSQATNGDATAQRSLGLHYLNGQGCTTNQSQAVYWLTQAANQGDIEASNKLANLQNRQY